MKKIKILIVDDSVLFRTQIQAALQSCPEFELLGTASNGKLALEKMEGLAPDLCILDIEMPVMDGLETLVEMKRRNIKTRAIMFSSQSKAGADRTLEAMRLGALDFVAKPLAEAPGGSPSEKIREALVPKLRSLFASSPLPSLKAIHPRSPVPLHFRPEVLVIASSTGGPNALVEFFSGVKEKFPFPVFVTQHMPPVFTASLAERIETSTGLRCKEGEDGELAKPGVVYVAPGNFHMSLRGSPEGVRIALDQGALRNFVRPCADYLLESAAEIFGPGALGLILTGMGRDGAEGAALIKKCSGLVLIQDQSSSVVFGMPGAVYEAGNFDFLGHPTALGEKVTQLIRARRAHVA